MFKVTIVEDQPAIRQMYALKLKFSNYQISEASDGIEGLRVIEQVLPDLILLDLMMPVMGGEHMLRELRSSDWGKDIPVVILTNISRDEAPRTLWHLGISDFIVKANSTPQKVLECVERVLGQAGTRA